jgi:2-polyprenyl-6-methoxyphenol hydroxylase-like FAD-dependent oxidoreductase
MPPPTSDSTGPKALPSSVRVHVVGAGPVGLLLTALLQSMEGFSVRLYEKRREYTRTRMVQLAPYLVADSVDSYRTDYIDGDNVDAVFDPAELHEDLAFRRSIPSDLMALLPDWTVGFCPLNSIERAVSDLIDSRVSNQVQRTTALVTAEDAMAMLEPGDILIDCTGSRSLLRDHLTTGTGQMDGGANTLRIRLEYALVITFLYGQTYDCNEHCKYYKNIENAQYKFIPMVNRTHYDGSVSHVTGIVNISADDYEAMPSRFDGEWLRDNFPGVAQSMDRFIDKIKEETHGEILGDLEIVRIPLDLYRARNATSRQWLTARPSDHPFASSPVLLAGDSAVGSPYFQSISLGFECAMYLAGLIAQRDVPLRDMLDRYELYIYKQWLRVYMRSKMIKHNKDLFESLDDPLALLDKLHIY